MGIRRRMMIAFAICFILPVAMLALAGTLIVRYHARALSDTYNIDTDITNFLQSSPRLFGILTRDEYQTLKKASEETPELLMDREWLAELNAEIAERNSYVVLRIDEYLRYNGNPEFVSKLESKLPEYGQGEMMGDAAVYVEAEQPAMVRQLDFKTQYDEEASIFLITDINLWLPVWKSTALQVLIALVVVFNLMAGGIVYWLYKSTMQPIAALRAAADQIRAGNLEGVIQGNEDDEIGKLQNAFDEMRVHLKTMSEQQLQYEKDSKQMVSYISHDLKTPLTAIKGYAEGLMDGVAATPEKQERYLKTIYAKACDMERLVDELAFFSKVEQDKMTYNFQKIGVLGYMEDCVEELQLDMEVVGIELEFSCVCAEEEKVIIDPEQIKRVINNIVSNSVKYMDKPAGHININVASEGDYINVEISDNGCGIREKDLPYVFERFYRGDSARSTKKGGSGLGLAIVKKIVTDHGGSIQADSTFGVGTTIRFSLPKKPELSTEEKED